jgi:receptor kinase-like protein
MLTGRRPTNNTFDGSLGLQNYVKMALDRNVMDIIDMELLTELENDRTTIPVPDPSSSTPRVDSLILLLKVGLLCSLETPSSRMATKEIIKELHVIKNALPDREHASI